jgi:hypothetical protein
MWALTPRELQRVVGAYQECGAAGRGLSPQDGAPLGNASSTNAILIQVNVAIGRSAEMAAPEEDVFLGGLYQRGSVAKCDGNSRYESR